MTLHLKNLVGTFIFHLFSAFKLQHTMESLEEKNKAKKQIEPEVIKEKNNISSEKTLDTYYKV